MQDKFKKLEKYLSELEKQGLCLAFSGGVDSALLLYLCRRMNILAVTFKTDFQSYDEIKEAKDFAMKYGVQNIILEADIFSNDIITKNPKDRCYYCKKMIFEKIIQIAKTRSKKYIIDGTNFDDLDVYRPGRKALLELGVISPLAEFKITKQEIRDYLKECKIEIFNKPSTPCLATRFPYGEKLTKEKLSIADKGEKILKSFGFCSSRFRLHGNVSRIEIPCSDFSKFLSQKNEILKSLKPLGIKYFTLDVEGLRSGCKNTTLE